MWCLIVSISDLCPLSYFAVVSLSGGASGWSWVSDGHTHLFLQDDVQATYSFQILKHIVQEPVIGLIKWSRPKGLKVCSYVKKCAKFKN